MEVDKISFYPRLLGILTNISEAHFVAIDLELSGVPSKQAGGSHGFSKPTLQQRYTDTKEAAERYQILQLGITTVEQDMDNHKYVLRPYNFELSPLIEERGLEIERIFSYQSGAVDFLLKVGFDMSMPFTRGIPYLSRDESREAREKHARRQDKTAIADIQIKPTETESLAFLDHVRQQIDAWLAPRDKYTLDRLNIGKTGTAFADDDIEYPEELSRFERRLVHQLVRAEYPELVTFGKRGFIQIVYFDQEREDKIAAQRKREIDEKISRQKGLRWVIEALRGSNIMNIDLRECARSAATGEYVFADFGEMRTNLHRAHERISGRPRVLVVHNGFLDLIYIYRTFIGQLPDTVEEFQDSLHQFWPVIIDTKYMATHNCGDINPVSSLEEIAEQISLLETPVLDVDQRHKKYEGNVALHEAGYDSFLTAQIAVRLSAKLESEGSYADLDAPPNQAETKEVAGGVRDLHVGESLLGQDDKWEDQAAPSFLSNTGESAWATAGDSWDFEATGWNDDGSMPTTYETFPGGMPKFDSDFWRVYGNKLRVFGTEEGVCVLDGSDKETWEVDEEDGGVGQGGVGVSLI